MINGIKKNTVENKKKSGWNATAYNKRFGEMAAGVTTQAGVFRETVSDSPSGVQLSSPLRQAAASLCASGQDCGEQIRETLNVKHMT